jgi:hypothetical protein
VLARPPEDSVTHEKECRKRSQPVEKVFCRAYQREKGPLPSVADAQPELKRRIERATKNETRWDLRERRRDIGLQEIERKQEAYSRQEGVSRGLSREASLRKQELFLLAMRYRDGCSPVRAAP